MIRLLPHILLVEDDFIWLSAVRSSMENMGWQVSTASDLESAKNILAKEKIDLCLIDIVLENNQSGFDLTEHINKLYPHILYIILSSKDGEQDRIKGLELGAQDYLNKPISLRELVLRLSRLKKVFSHSADEKTLDEKIHFGEFTFHVLDQELFYKRQFVHLTHNEKQLLYYFLTTALGKLHREFISEQILKKTYHPSDRSVDMLISHLRQKLNTISQQVSIKPLRGQGYQFLTN